PLGEETHRAVEQHWQRLTEGQPEQEAVVEVMSRRIEVSRSAGRAARFTFAELCERPLAARDYLALAGHFDTFLVEDVPQMDETRRNEAKRFILLIDTLYDRQRRLIVSADAPPDQLYTARTGREAFEFARTASRLIEMQGADWARKEVTFT